MLGSLQIKLRKEMNRRKGTQLLIFTCLGVQRKEVKLKEVAVFRVLYTILTKKKVGGDWALRDDKSYGSD